MKSRSKRIAALVLAVMMVLSMMPGAMAAEYFSGSLSVGGRVKRATPAPTEAPAAEATPAPTEEVPVATEAPAATEEPTAAEVPVATEEPAATEVPAATEEPAAAEVPEATEVPAVTAEPTPELRIGMIYKKGDDNTANIRKEPTSSSDKLGIAHHGDMITVYEQEGSWLYGEIIGLMGWVHGGMVTFDESLFNVVEATQEPTAEPMVEPTVEPSVEPTVEPSVEPTVEPSVEPTAEPTEEPTVNATEEPVVEATEEPVVEETEEPTEVLEPTAEPEVSVEPTVEPSIEPEVSVEPTVEPTEEPVVEATEEPVEVLEPTAEPEVSVEPTVEPSIEPEASVEPIAVETVSEYQVDENGELILDENGNPIPVITEVTDDEATEEEEIVEVNIRLEADGLSEIILSVPVETEAIVIGVEGDWVNVDVDGVVGYIFVDDAELMPNLIGMPVAEETPTPEETVAPTANMKVTIFTSRRSVVQPGETICLTSKIEGFEGYEILYVWECDKGAGFEAIEGAHADTYSYTASIETLSYDWRLTVYYR